MARKKKDTFENFYFTVDGWAREYRFEINRHRWELDPDYHSERDEIRIFGRFRAKTKRKIVSGMLENDFINTKNTSFEIVADIETSDQPANRVIVFQGGRFGG